MGPKYYGAAANYNKPQGLQFNNRLFLFAALGVVLLIIISVAGAMFNAYTSGPKNDLATLIIRQRSLGKFIADNQPGIKSGDLSKISSDAALYLASDSFILKEQLVDTYGQTELPADIAAAEADTTSKKELEDASKLNRFDSTYAQLFKDKLTAIDSQAQKVRASSSNALLAAVDESLNNLKVLREQLDKLQL